jgi:cytidylate kinase
MTSNFYLHRTLFSGDRTYSEAALLAASRFIVVLAEPGAGKTRLMESLAQQLGASLVTASRFAHTGAQANGTPLLLDAYDELAKIDASGIYKMLAAAHAASPTNLVISSRSSEWDNAANSTFNEFFGASPLVARLSEFAQDEQQKIFEHHSPKEDFSAFQAEVARFDLETLLPNPQFLTLFADAYLESGRKFTDKKSIFSLALERLAKEANASVKNTVGSLSAARKVDAASEVFAKLLLSGAEGVATSEASEDALYPLLGSLVEDASSINSILSTRMFKPGDTVDTHRPVHKIIAEYAAASYFTKRIADPADALTLDRCLPVIAPNSTTRDELRGLLGWMASLGNKPIQDAAIELDPYAVLANGDPSQLDATSKRLLIKRLKDIEEKDPYFRRGDFWRRFSVAGFFTPEVVGEIKPLLSRGAEGHLRDLILELLDGSPAIQHLSDELRALLLAPQESENTRLLALNCLLGQGKSYDHLGDIAILVFEASQTSLKLVAKAIEKRGSKTFGDQHLLGYFRVCAHLYPGHKERFERTIGARHFVKRLVSQLDLSTVEHLINGLTGGLTCNCGKKNYECDCRNGTSKIVGALLDRYFELSPPPHDPVQVWKWVQNLNYHQNKSADQSKAVEVLQSDRDLRQGIIKHVFGKLTDSDEIFETTVHRFDWKSHSGLGFRQDDYEFIVDHAYDNENPALWAAFMARHQIHRDKAKRGPDQLRRHMREQALNKPAFMREWVKSNRDAARFERENRIPSFRHSRRMKQRRNRENEMHAANIKYVHENRALVEGGRHWSCLVRFAELVLMQPDKIEEEFGDEVIVRNGLRNCLDFISPHVPDLAKLAELQCASQYQHSETILYAACLELLRRDGNLNSVPINLLWALRANLDMHYDAVQDSEREALKVEANRLALATIEAVEQFCRQYIEPQLRDPQCNHPQVHWLRHDPVFQPLAPSLAYEWLRDFELMPVSALDILFEIVAQYGDQEQLTELIAFRSSQVLLFWSPELSPEDLEERRTFWFMRAIYFLEGSANPYWDWLKYDKENVFLFNERSGRMNRSDYPAWPRLTSDKVEAILEAFFQHWPKVPLPSSWGTGSPKGETAYRFLTDVIWSIHADDPDKAIPALKRLLDNAHYVELHKDMKSMLAGLERKKALLDFKPPSTGEIVAMLDRGEVVTVEGLRQLVLLELSKLQNAIDGGEFNTAERFYAGDKRLDEEPCTRIIAERLNLILVPQNITVTPEHHLKHDKRCDFTTAKVLDGKRRMIVTEVKGQWHPKLYEAASDQLNNLYAIHPDAEQQGIYLVIWFGENERVAAVKKHGLSSSKALKEKLEHDLPDELRGLIDVFVLDVSKQT